jgi:phosphonoacetaldehyde hydrolase
MRTPEETAQARLYQGPVKAVILDWSGTTVDAYVIAPAIVFVEVFDNQGVDISMEEARVPMGLRKDLHIRALTETPEIRQRWIAVHGTEPTQADVDRMFADFVPIQLECLPRYTALLPGVADVTQALQSENIKIGSTTGFIRPMVDVLERDAAEQGYVPDASVAGDEVEHGARPSPFMVYRNLDLLDAWPIQSVIKVDDTVGGVGEGINAGCWAVGIARYSNYMNINSLEEAESMSQEELDRRLHLTRQRLTEAGAHYVINTITELPGVVADVNERLSTGQHP